MTIRGSLQCNNEAIEKYIHPKAMVPHIKNRGASKMQWTKIWQKGTKILVVGPSLDACGPDRAVAFGEEGDKPSARAHVALCKNSEFYADYDDVNDIEAASVGCGHWNQMLANICDRIPVPKEYQGNTKVCEAGRPYLDKDSWCRSLSSS